MSHYTQVSNDFTAEENLLHLIKSAARMGYDPIEHMVCRCGELKVVFRQTSPRVYRIMTLDGRLHLWRKHDRSREFIRFMFGKPLPLP